MPKKSRIFSLANIQSFKNSLQSLNWLNVLTFHETNLSFELFWDTFYSLFELHFPLTSLKFNKNLHPKNEFMTPGLITSRNNKNNLHKLSLSDPNLYLVKYKRYRNVYNTLLRASKKLHYERKFEIYAKKQQKTWKLLNELTLGSAIMGLDWYCTDMLKVRHLCRCGLI
jgi:hypothetical protein